MTRDSDPTISMTLSQFLTGAAIFEGMLLLVAFLIGALLGVSPTAQLSWSTDDFLLGLLATCPMLLLLAACFLSRSQGIVSIRLFLRDTLGPFLHQCRFIDLLFLALLAGVCEEVLFRGFLYFWIRDWNPMLAVVICNVCFGMAHAITPLYALLAGFLGLYLTALVAVDSSPNLLIPMTAHTAYDLIGFLIVVRDFRASRRQPADRPPTADAPRE